MEILEKVEKIREKTGVSYEDAREALLNSNEDILDTIVYLEKKGKIPAPETSSYKSVFEESEYTKDFENAQASYEKNCEEKKCEKAAKRFFEKCKEILEASIKSTFTISKDGESIIRVPVLVLVLLLLFAFYVTVPLLIVGLFFDLKYSFQGFTDVAVNFNDVCDKASDICNDIKEDVTAHKAN